MAIARAFAHYNRASFLLYNKFRRIAELKIVGVSTQCDSDRHPARDFDSLENVVILADNDASNTTYP